MTEDFGSYLKSERELRGVPLEEISSVTRIPIRFLQALENNRFDDLPGEVFVKGYIRSIAKVIGSDPDAMVSTYDEISEKLSPTIKTETASVVEGKIPSDMDFILKVGLIILFLVGLGWSIRAVIAVPNGIKKQHKSVVPKSDQNKIDKLATKKLSASNKELKNELRSKSKNLTPSNMLRKPAESGNLTKEPPSNLSDVPIQSIDSLSVTANALEAKVDSMTLSTNASETRNDNSSSNSVNENDMPLKLTINVKDNAWFNLKVDSSNGEDFIFPKGTIRTFYGKNNFRVAIGNRDAIDLKLNDKDLSLPDGDENNVVREFIINSKLID